MESDNLTMFGNQLIMSALFMFIFISILFVFRGMNFLQFPKDKMPHLYRTIHQMKMEQTKNGGKLLKDSKYKGFFEKLQSYKPIAMCLLG